MAKVELELEPCPRCKRSVFLNQQQGGRGTEELTTYCVICECGLREENFGDNGRRDNAVRQWDRWVRKNGGASKAIAPNQTLSPAVAHVVDAASEQATFTILTSKQETFFADYETATTFEPMHVDEVRAGTMTFEEAAKANCLWFEDWARDAHLRATNAMRMRPFRATDLTGGK